MDYGMFYRKADKQLIKKSNYVFSSMFLISEKNKLLLSTATEYLVR